MRNRRLLAILAIVIGLVLIAIAIVYWVEPAKSLPSFFPGHQAGSNHRHTKHGIAAFLVGLACLVFAWFNTGGPRAPRSAA
jgi:1,4-dihydroxy-2-naphthoate octaprenyltransferase